MTTAVDYHNDLERLFSRLPGWLQSPLSGVYHELDRLLQDVAGNPEELIQASEKYPALAAQIKQLALQQRSDRTSLLTGEWKGQAYDAFSRLMPEVEAQIELLATSVGDTKEVLTSAAQACLDGANAICEIVDALITWIVSTVIANLLLAVFSFGLSLAAEVAEAMGGALDALTQAWQVSERVASVIEKVGQVLENIEKTMLQIEKVLSMLLRGFGDDGKISEDFKLINVLKPWGLTNPVDILEKDGEHIVENYALRMATRLGVTVGERTVARELVSYASTGTNTRGSGSEVTRSGDSALNAWRAAGTAEHDASETDLLPQTTPHPSPETGPGPSPEAGPSPQPVPSAHASPHSGPSPQPSPSPQPAAATPPPAASAGQARQPGSSSGQSGEPGPSPDPVPQPGASPQPGSPPAARQPGGSAQPSPEPQPSPSP
jgi:uncharacterized protein YukE